MNMYWSIYESLEEETLKLADNIFFTNEQLNVYSLSIGNLIIRCAIEIESLSKELYIRLGGSQLVIDKVTNQNREPFFDTECLNLLVELWQVDRKKLQITSPKMYFDSEKVVLTPLKKSNKRGTSGSKWKQAYQGIKHNRTKEFKKATIENLLNALGALYILNIYYRNDSYWCGTPIEGKEEYKNDSKIFTPYIYDVSHHISLNDNNENINSSYYESIYIKKYTNNVVQQIRNFMFNINLGLFLNGISSDEFLKYKMDHPNEIEINSMNINFFESIGLNVENIFKNIDVRSIPIEILKSKEIILNNSLPIYPEQKYEDFLKTNEAQNMITKTMNKLNEKFNALITSIHREKPAPN